MAISVNFSNCISLNMYEYGKDIFTWLETDKSMVSYTLCRRYMNGNMPHNKFYAEI